MEGSERSLETCLVCGAGYILWSERPKWDYPYYLCHRCRQETGRPEKKDEEREPIKKL